MIPFGNHTVTLIHSVEAVNMNGKTAVAYVVDKLHGCSWHTARTGNINSDTLSKAESVVCRIPAKEKKPAIGDVLILNDIEAYPETANDVQQLLDKYRDDANAFKVMRVGDNTLCGFLAHYSASGE